MFADFPNYAFKHDTKNARQARYREHDYGGRKQKVKDYHKDYDRKRKLKKHEEKTSQQRVEKAASVSNETCLFGPKQSLPRNKLGHLKLAYSLLSNVVGGFGSGR